MSRDTRATDSGRVLDDATRYRRQKNALDALERDNFQEEPHADLVMSKKIPKFHESLDGSSSGSKKKKRQRSEDYYKQKFRRNLGQLVEEDLLTRPDGPNYMTAEAPESRYPKRNFCAVCGNFSEYTCVQCGTRFCRAKCLQMHNETRCMKWTA